MFDFLTIIPVIGPTLAVLLPFIIVIGIVVAIHEYGHYIVGRWCGIDAEVFSLGFGPVLWSGVDRRGTRWQLAAIPLGGYVKFLGDANPASGTTDEEALEGLSPEVAARTFPGAALWKRALTVFAGPAANFVLTIVMFSVIATVVGRQTDSMVIGELRTVPGIESGLQVGDRIKSIDGQPYDLISEITQEHLRAMDPVSPTYVVDRDGTELTVKGPHLWTPVVNFVTPGGAAAWAGLREGDVIVSFNGVQVTNFLQLIDTIPNSDGTRITFEVLRDGTPMTLEIKPLSQTVPTEDNSFEERVQIGVGGAFLFEPPWDTVPLSQGLQAGVMALVANVDLFLRSIWSLITGAVSLKNVQGPVGIAVAAGDSAAQGFESFLYLIASISAIIGLMNLLPIPVLDGGHLLIFAIQAVTGRPPSERALQVVMTAGLALLLSLFVMATYNDIGRLLSLAFG